MSSANVQLVRSIYAAWERGDYTSSEWAHPEIEYVAADGPSPGRWTGLAGMAEGWRDWLSAWEEYRTEVDEYRALRRYDWWLLEGWRETHFATHASPPAVVFVTSRERPLRRLVATADQVLSAGHGREDAGPREGTHPAREQILFTSRDRIRAGDWTMERTPSLPPVLRVQPDVCSPRSVVYDMRSMFANRSPQPSEFALIPGGRDMQ